MSDLSESKKQSDGLMTPNSSSSTSSHALEPPKYYDSEPSSQPPQYSQTFRGSTARPSNSGGGASAASIAAILAYPSERQLQDKKERDSRTWRERWRDWKARHNDPELGGGMQVSGPTLNVQGIGLKSWTSINNQQPKRR